MQLIVFTKVGSVESGFRPLAVADPHLAKLQLPVNKDYYDWGGQFNFVLDDVHVPENASIVAISWIGNDRRRIVLGKRSKAVMYLSKLPAGPIDKDPVAAEYYTLPGMEASDVQWGEADQEDFWIGTLAPGSGEIVDEQPLSSMVPEPAGELDQQ